MVDDDQTNRAILVRILERAGFRVQSFDGAGACLAAVRGGQVDFLFTDVDMPEMNGVELMRAVKKLDSDIEVIVMTAGAEVAPALEAKRLGALDYLRKPFTDRGAVAKVAQKAASRVNAKRSARAQAAEEGFHLSGQLDETTDLPQVLQVIVALGRDGVLKLEGPPAGRIWVREGKLVNACMGSLRAEKALYRLLREARGQYSLEAFAPPVDGEPLGQSVEACVFEGVRREDEFRALEGSLPDLDRRWILAEDCTAKLADLDPTLLQVLAAVTRAPHARDALELPDCGDVEILTALRELLKLGALHPADR